MSKEKEHTFVICAYEKSRYIERCIKSLMSQSIKSDIIIATSTDNTYLRKLSNKYNIKLLVNDSRPSLAGDWNYALSVSKTELVTLAHQDDIYLPNYAKCVIEAYKKADNPIIIFTDYGEIRGNRKVKSNSLLRIKRILLSPLLIKRNRNKIWIRRRILSFGSAISCPTVTYVSDSIPKPLFLDNMQSNIDWQAWERISKNKGDFVYIPRILMYHRIHSESTTTKIIKDSSRQKEDLIILKKFWPMPIAKTIEFFYRYSEKSNDNE